MKNKIKTSLVQDILIQAKSKLENWKESPSSEHFIEAESVLKFIYQIENSCEYPYEDFIEFNFNQDTIDILEDMLENFDYFDDEAISIRAKIDVMKYFLENCE
jgi:hypothetical protein